MRRFIICLFGFLLPAFAAPAIYDGGVANGADYTRICGPGMIFSIFGTGFSGGVTQASGAPLPKVLDGVSVDVLDGQKTLAAPLFFVAPGQINAQMPFEVSGASVQVRVKNAQGQSGTQSISITPRCPRLFTKLLNGKGEPIVVHVDNSLVSTAWPARGNEIVVMYLTGLGATKPAATTGGAGGDGGGLGPLNLVGDPVTVKVGDQPAEVHWVGLAPYFVGLYQLNFQIPATLASGMQPITVSAGGQTSQEEVTLAVRAGQPLTTATVGAGGGSVEAGGLTLNVPAGAFPSASSIALSKAAPGGDSPASTASATYLVEGLPAEWNAPMEVAIELTRAPESGKSVFVVVQIGMEGASIAKPVYLPARVEGNRALATIPAASPAAAATAASKAGGSREASGQLKQAAGKAWMSLRAETGYEVGTCAAGSSFEMWISASDGISKDATCALQEGLDDAKTKLETIAGLNWKARTDWPLKVRVRPFLRLAWESTLPSIADRETYGLEGRMPLWGARVQDMDLNSNLLSTPAQVAEMKRTGAHELFHVLQNLYDPRTNYAIASGPNNWLWFMEAASTWFERAYWGQSDFIPETTKRDYYFLTIRGLEVPPANLAQAIVQAHGYGRRSFSSIFPKPKAQRLLEIF